MNWSLANEIGQWIFLVYLFCTVCSNNAAIIKILKSFDRRIKK
jgi:hypothetical protein